MNLDKLQALLEQEMSRKEFLRLVGVIILSVVGITSMLNNLQNVHKITERHVKTVSGYGYNTYGR